MSKIKKVNSIALNLLEQLGIQYRIKGREAYLVDYDSLKISLAPNRVDTWKRWSTGDKGSNANSLIIYLMKQGIISHSEAISVLGDKVAHEHTVEVEVKEFTDVDFQNLIRDPNNYQLKEYLEFQRLINPMMIDALLEQEKIDEDVHNNVRFLFTSPSGVITGAEMIGLHFKERTKYSLPNSTGYFFLKTKDVEDWSDVETVVLFEAPLDLISYVEMMGYSPQLRDRIPQTLPSVKTKTLFLSLAGSVTKIETALKKIESDFGLPLKDLNVVVATDNDEAGEETFEIVKKHFPQTVREKTESRSEPVKDWNDLLKLIKKGSG